MPVNTTAAQLAAALASTATPGVDPGVGLRAARQAQALAVALAREDERLRAGAWACIHQMLLGQHAAMLAEAPALLPRMTAPTLAPLKRELLRCVTLSGSEVGAFDQALDAAHELSQACRDSGDEDAALGAAYALAVCLERMGDSWQAVRLLSDALAAYGHRSASRALLVATNAACAINLGMAHRLRGTGADAERSQALASGRAQGEQALTLLAQLAEPTYEVAVLGNLGETRLLQGEIDSARPLIDQALALAQQRGLSAHAWRVRTSLADWLLAAGHAQEALDAATALLADMGHLGDGAPRQTAIRAHDSAYRSSRALGQHALALQHLEAAERLDRQRTIAQLRSQSHLFVTRTEAQRARAQADQAHADAAWQRERAAEYAAAAERDPLTTLGNRRHLERRSAELLPASAEAGQPLALALLDIDHFKRVNDQHGHACGDRVLVILSQLLRENTRAGDVLARLGGEEFVIVLPGMTLERAAEVCNRLRERVAAHPWALLCGRDVRVTISIGLAAVPPHELAPLLEAADHALYRAKHGGRNSLVVQAV